MIENHPLYPLFYPKNIAIIGASPTPNMSVSFYLDSFKEYGLGITKRPNIYPVNPKYTGQKIHGVYTCYADLKSIPERPIDIVLCAINAKYVSNLLKQCHEEKAKFLVIYTSGFSEVGERGLRYDKELKEMIKQDNTTRVIGPNCFGTVNSEINMNFNVMAHLNPGDVSFFSQSGGFANTLIEHSGSRGIGINVGVSVGNMIDLDMNEFLDYFYHDPKTNFIGFYLESVQDQEKGRRFLEVTREINQKKPIVIFKGGKTQRGAKAALSHTGAVAGSQKIYDSVFNQSGIISVQNSIEFYDCVHLISRLFPERMPKGRKACLVVPGGGFSVEMADIFTNIGLKIPDLSQSIQNTLSSMLFDVNTSFKNPIDVGAYGILPEFFLNTIKAVIKEENFDIIIPYLQVSRILGLKLNYKGFGSIFARALARIIRKTNKTFILINRIDQEFPEYIKENNKIKAILDKNKIPHFPSIPRAARALEYILKYDDFQKKLKK